jgi:hypothetical protein
VTKNRKLKPYGCKWETRIRLTLLGTIQATRLLASLNTKGVESTANNVITNTWKISDSPAANKHDGMFLKIVTFTRNVNGDFFGV